MSKEISLSVNCTQGCTQKHPLGRDHTLIELRRFKNKLTEFLSIDDEHWYPAFELVDQLDELIRTVQKLKNELDNRIIEKRLLYALNFESDKQVLNIFKQANSDQFDQLTCEDVAIIMKKIDKARNPKASEIRVLINNLMKEEKLIISQKMSESLDKFRNNEETEVKTRQNTTVPVRQQYREQQKLQRGNRERRFRRADQNSEKELTNDLPNVKVNQIQETQGHFNIILKVIKVKKQFILGDNKRKIEFEGGDETGLATAVVDCLRMIKPGAVIKINNARVYSFHGTKQIQQNNKNSYMEQLQREVRVSEQYNFSAGRRRREPRQPQETRQVRERRQVRETRELRRQVYDHRRVPEERQQREPRTKREVRVDRAERTDRTDRVDRGDRLERMDRTQSTNISQVRRQPLPRERRNRDQYQKVQIEQQQRRRQKPLREQQSGQYSDDQGEESAEQQVEKKPMRHQKVQDVPHSKTLTKIKDIEPQMENISLVAEIVSLGKCTKVANVKVDTDCIFAVLGDETGIIWAELPQHLSFIRENSVILLKDVEVHVHETQCRLILRLGQGGQVQKTAMRMQKINLQNDMSQQAWIQQEEEQQQQEPKDIVQDF